jgi:2-polyprenyl-3-methyl-5-hydroxy-6-metoxy-1,4-benzoquinol methylase
MATSFDVPRAEAFAGRMLGVLNDGFLSLMVSVGHQTGLFDAMTGRAPATSGEVAATAGLQERYVREWLGAMVVGGVVTYDPATRTYGFPDEHAACLTRAAGADNLAEMARFVAMLGEVEPAIAKVFREGGGLPYASFPRFHEVLADAGRPVFEATLFNRTLPLVAGLTGRLEAGIDVLDVGCGRGVAVAMMARRYPRSRFVGLDISEEALAWARDAAGSEGLENARYVVQDAARLGPEDGSYDFVTCFDAIHDQAHPRTVLRGIRSVLKPGGTFLMVDIAASSHLERNLDHPLGPFLYTASTLHCMTVSLAQGGEGLGACWGEELARELLAEAGFTQVEVARVAQDPLNAYYVCRP